jgi:predicted MFS family arabinose efflux permease
MTSEALKTIRLSILGSVSILPLLILPAMVGALIDHAAFGQSEAGWVAAIGSAGSAFGAIIIGIRIRHLDPRALAVVGLTVLAIADAASALVAQMPVWLFLCIRAISGLGGAAAYASVMATIAASPKPERGYGTFMVFQFGLSAFGLYVMPHMLPGAGVEGMYLALAIAALLALSQTSVVLQRAVKIVDAAIELRALLKPAAILAMLGIGLYETANIMHFTYAERIGVGFGFALPEIGKILAIATILGIPSAFSVVWLGDRFGQLGPIAIALMLSVAALIWLLNPTGSMTYVTVMCALSIAWAFGLPYFHSFAARLDPGGSVVVAAGFFTAAGGALGPAIAATLVGSNVYANVLMFAIGVYGVVAVLMTMSRKLAAQRVA